jgi:DNA-binding XRE family transcriptional regulator
MNILQTTYTECMEIQRVVALNVIRARGGMSRQKLAKLAGVTYQHIYEIEENLKKPSLKVLERVAAALNIEVADLFKREVQKERPVVISSALRKLLLIPDRIYDMVEDFGDDKDVWDDVEVALNRARLRKQSKLRGQSDEA